MQLELCKTSDFIQCEYGINLTNLLRYIQKNKIDQKDEIKSFKKMFEMQKLTEQKNRLKKTTPSKDIIVRMIEEAKSCGAPQIKKDGCLTFDYFLETSKIVFKYHQEMTKDGFEESIVKRRELLKEGKTEEFTQLVLETSNWETECRLTISGRLYNFLKVPKPAQEKSYKKYLMDFEKRKAYETEMESLKAD